MKRDKEFNILNLSEENGIYTLEHVTIDTKDSINNFPIYKTNNPIYESTFIIFNNILYCVLSEHNKLMYSSFNGMKWSNSSEIDTESFDNIGMYKYIYEESPLDKSIESKTYLLLYPMILIYFYLKSLKHIIIKTMINMMRKVL